MGRGTYLAVGPDGTPQQRHYRNNSWHDPERQDIFFAALAAGSSVTLAARTAGLHPKNGYRLRAKDAAFAERWRLALIAGQRSLRELLREWAGITLARANRDPGKVDPATVGQSIKLAQWLLVRYGEAGGAGGELRARPPTTDELRASINAKLEAAAAGLRRLESGGAPDPSAAPAAPEGAAEAGSVGEEEPE